MSIFRNDEIERFFEKGYGLFRQLIPQSTADEVGSFLADRLTFDFKEYFSDIDLKNCPTDLIQHYKIRGEFESLDKQKKAVLFGHFGLGTRLSPVLRRVAQSPDLVMLLRTLLKSDEVFMHMPPMARHVRPGNSYAKTPPHRDAGYNDHMDSFLTVWTPFVEIDEQCGGVRIYEEESVGVNKYTQFTKGDPGQDFWLPPIDTNATQSVNFSMSPGDILIFRQDILHGSIPNTSDRVRISMDMRFIGRRQSSHKHLLDLQTGKILDPQGL